MVPEGIPPLPVVARPHPAWVIPEIAEALEVWLPLAARRAAVMVVVVRLVHEEMVERGHRP